jgi:hypothetical protein
LDILKDVAMAQHCEHWWGHLLGEADDPDDGLVLLCNDGASLVILLGTVLG